MFKAFMFFLKQLAGIYHYHIHYKSIRRNLIKDLMIMDSFGHTYTFGDVRYKMHSFNPISKTFHIELSFHGMDIEVHMADSCNIIKISCINLMRIKQVIGTSALNNWDSVGDMNINIVQDATTHQYDWLEPTTIDWSGSVQIIDKQGIKDGTEWIINSLKNRHHMGQLIHYSDDIKREIMATEDPFFYEHPGTSVKTILRAAKINSQVNKLIKGGSSITCQLVKNAFLSQERSFYRKIVEACMALIIEQHYKVPKDDIFDIYLSMLEMAPDVYGLNEGALHYFGRPLAELEPYEFHVLQYFIPRPIYVPEAINMNSYRFRIGVRVFLEKIYDEKPKVLKFAPPYQHIYLR